MLGYKELAAAVRASGYALPPAKPAGLYAPAVHAGGLAWVSGQLPFDDTGAVLRGCLRPGADLEPAQWAARRAAQSLLLQVAELGVAVRRCLRLEVFVACEAGFEAQAVVANGASELVREVLGEAGVGSRAAVGVSALPRGALVEVTGVFELRL